MERRKDLVDAARVIGPILAGVGGLMFIVGFLAFASFEPTPFGPMPSITLPFLGMLLLAAGATITKWAYVGPVATYVATETAPAVGIATRAVLNEARPPPRPCQACATPNASDATFCKGCGRALGVRCGSCGGGNAPDARFCDDCGKPILR